MIDTANMATMLPHGYGLIVPMSNSEQIGDYVIYSATSNAGRLLWIVRMAGAEEAISDHDTKALARAAVKRYRAGDKRRSRSSP